MNHEPDLITITKPIRTPLADDLRSKKKVRMEDGGEGKDVMDAEASPEARPHDCEVMQKQLFDDGVTTPDHMDCEGTSDSSKPATAMTFRDKLLSGQPRPEPEETPDLEEVTVSAEDFSIAMEGLVPSITFSERIHKLMAESMRYAVVVKLLGRFMRQDTLYTKIENLWKPKSGFKLTELEGGCYLVRLHCNSDYQKALLGGPWVVLGHYLTVHPWDPELSPQHLEIKHVYEWVRLPGLPFHYYHKHLLRTIGDLIGEVLKIDYNTEGGVKARFARMAVKINLQQPLVSRIKLDGITQFIEYEGLPTICYNCGCYGHLDTICPRKPQQVPQASVPAPAQPPSTPVAEPARSGALHEFLICSS